MKLFKSILSLFLAVSAVSASAQVLYKVEGNGLTQPSYVFGTHHLAPISVIEQFGAAEPFNNSTQVVGEIDMTQDQMQMAMAMQSHMVAPTDSTLSKVIPSDEFQTVNEQFKKWAPMPGMDLTMLEPMKPMVISTMVVVGMTREAMPDFNPEQQLDTWFQSTGKEQNKVVIPLETAEQQAEILFDTTPISYQADALVEMLKNPKKTLDQTKNLNDAYMAQDLAKMLQLSEEDDEHPEFMMALLDKRNADWLTKLPAIFKDGSTFVAVGALHLAGDKGIIEGLRKLGYTVTPIAK
ncbi:MAG: TraB/GumN family protein [Bacteroides sp.]|nr:TraB/GumN family protein [Bacteroides sp.]